MGKSSQAGMVIDAEVTHREERPVTSGTSASRWAPTPPEPQESPAAPPSAPASGKPKRKRRPRKTGAPEAPPVLRQGALKVKLPPPPAVRGLICPVCLAPAEPDRRVELGPVHAYLCDRCGGFAAGALQVMDFFKKMR